MDSFERTLNLLKKWDDQNVGATDNELMELRDTLIDVLKEVNDTLKSRQSEQE